MENVLKKIEKHLIEKENNKTVYIKDLFDSASETHSSTLTELLPDTIESKWMQSCFDTAELFERQDSLETLKLFTSAQPLLAMNLESVQSAEEIYRRVLRINQMTPTDTLSKRIQHAAEKVIFEWEHQVAFNAAKYTWQSNVSRIFSFFKGVTEVFNRNTFHNYCIVLAPGCFYFASKINEIFLPIIVIDQKVQDIDNCKAWIIFLNSLIKNHLKQITFNERDHAVLGKVFFMFLTLNLNITDLSTQQALSMMNLIKNVPQQFQELKLRDYFTGIEVDMLNRDSVASLNYDKFCSLWFTPFKVDKQLKFTVRLARLFVISFLTYMQYSAKFTRYLLLTPFRGKHLFFARTTPLFERRTQEVFDSIPLTVHGVSLQFSVAGLSINLFEAPISLANNLELLSYLHNIHTQISCYLNFKRQAFFMSKSIYLTQEEEQQQHLANYPSKYKSKCLSIAADLPLFKPGVVWWNLESTCFSPMNLDFFYSQLEFLEKSASYLNEQTFSEIHGQSSELPIVLPDDLWK